MVKMAKMMSSIYSPYVVAMLMFIHIKIDRVENKFYVWLLTCCHVFIFFFASSLLSIQKNRKSIQMPKVCVMRVYLSIYSADRKKKKCDKIIWTEIT